MKISKSRLYKLGLFVSAGLLILIVAVYYLGRQQNIFRSGMTVYAEFANIKGLQVGNNVRFLGTHAGHVSNINVVNDSTIRIAIVIDHGMSRYIRANSEVEIKNDGIMGSKILEINPGTAGFSLIEPKITLPARETLSMEEIFNALEGTIENSTRASKNLLVITENLLRGQGFLGRLISDPAMNESIDEITSNLVVITHDATNAIERFTSDDNVIGKLLNDDQYVKSLDKTFDGIDTLLINLRIASDEIRSAANALNQGDGMLYRLLHDRELANEADTTITNLNEALENVIETTEVIRRSWIFNLFSRN